MLNQRKELEEELTCIERKKVRRVWMFITFYPCATRDIWLRDELKERGDKFRFFYSFLSLCYSLVLQDSHSTSKGLLLSTTLSVSFRYLESDLSYDANFTARIGLLGPPYRACFLQQAWGLWLKKKFHFQ